MEHVLRDGANPGGYYYACSCGWESLYNQTIKENRKERDRHLRDVEESRLWYVVFPDGGVSKPFETKKQALRSVGATTSTRLSPGRYAAAGGHVVTQHVKETV